MVTIGLFGTCGGSRWRERFIECYNKEGISFFNPQVIDWKPEDAAEEARHLAEDQIILFPVTDETYAGGSLAETGFSILQAVRLDDRREFVIMISRNLVDTLDDQIARKESLRARALVNEHLRKLKLPNVYMVDSLEEMLEVSLRLHPVAVIREELSKFNPQNRKR